MIGQAERISQLSLFVEEKSIKSTTPIIGITSGKGGTGKSFFTLNIAKVLNEKGFKILVIDMDLNFSNLHVLQNIFPETTIKDFFIGKTDINQLIHKEKFSDFIFGESGSRIEITETKINYFFKNLSLILANYDFILIDTASGGSELTMSILEKTTNQIVVANPDPTSVMDAYVIIKLMREKGILNEKQIVVNKCENLDEGKVAFENINKATLHFLKSKNINLGIIPFDSEIRKMSKMQEIFYQKDSANSTCSILANISENMIKNIHLAKKSQRRNVL